jgi:hypothetical protein
MILKRAVLTAVMSLFVSVSPAVGGNGTAFAAPSSAAQHLHYSYCAEGLFCLTQDDLYQITFIKNGAAASTFVHTDYSITWYTPCESTSIVRSKSHSLLNLETAGIQQRTFKGEQIAFYAECNGEPAKTCTSTPHYTIANGVLRHEGRDDYTCTDA